MKFLELELTYLHKKSFRVFCIRHGNHNDVYCDTKKHKSEDNHHCLCDMDSFLKNTK